MTQTTRNYAKVLYDLKVPKEAVEQAKDIFGKSPELRETLVNPECSQTPLPAPGHRRFSADFRELLKTGM